jgi:hypothetical protein
VLSTIGPFVDYYFMPDQGFHAQAGFAFAVAPLKLSNGLVDSKITPTGWAAMLGTGWESWVGEQWGIGVLARVQYSRLHASEATIEGGNADQTVDLDLTEHVIVPAVLFTATYH